MRICGFTDNLNLTEREFLKRELQIKLQQINPDSLLSNQFFCESSLILIVSTNPGKWREVVKYRKPDSVIFILLGNETYEWQTYLALSSLNAIRKAYIYGLPRDSNKFSSMGGFIGQLRDSSDLDIDYLIQCIRDLRTGFLKINQYRHLSFPFPVQRFPQGYSNSFAYQVSRFLPAIKDDESFMNSSSLMDLVAKKTPEMRFGFLGQKGSRRRADVIQILKAYPNTHVIERGGFGGNNIDVDDTYLKMLLNVQVNVIPPGNFNILNHRYTESLLTANLPLIVPNIPTDGFGNDHWSRGMKGLKKFSYRSLLSEIASWRNSEINSQILIAKSIDSHEISLTRESILEEFL